MRTVLLMAAVAAMLMVSTAEAQRGGQGGRGGGFDPAAIVERMFEQDANEDGKLAKDEIDERMQRMFDWLTQTAMDS